jgi:hypothetical protein
VLREITIRPVLNGYIVGIGSSALVYSSQSRLVEDLPSLLHPSDTCVEPLEQPVAENSLINRLPKAFD